MSPQPIRARVISVLFYNWIFDYSANQERILKFYSYSGIDAISSNERTLRKAKIVKSFQNQKTFSTLRLSDTYICNVL